MKNLSAISIVVLLAVVAGCDSKSGEPHATDDYAGHTAHANEGHEHHASMPHEEPTDMSLYQVNSQWTTQQGKTIELQDLQAGTTFSSVCPPPLETGIT